MDKVARSLVRSRNSNRPPRPRFDRKFSVNRAPSSRTRYSLLTARNEIRDSSNCYDRFANRRILETRVSSYRGRKKLGRNDSWKVYGVPWSVREGKLRRGRLQTRLFQLNGGDVLYGKLRNTRVVLIPPPPPRPVAKRIRLLRVYGGKCPAMKERLRFRAVRYCEHCGASRLRLYARRLPPGGNKTARSRPLPNYRSGGSRELNLTS